MFAHGSGSIGYKKSLLIKLFKVTNIFEIINYCFNESMLSVKINDLSFVWIEKALKCMVDLSHNPLRPFSWPQQNQYKTYQEQYQVLGICVDNHLYTFILVLSRPLKEHTCRHNDIKNKNDNSVHL